MADPTVSAATIIAARTTDRPEEDRRDKYRAAGAMAKDTPVMAASNAACVNTADQTPSFDRSGTLYRIPTTVNTATNPAYQIAALLHASRALESNADKTSVRRSVSNARVSTAAIAK